MRSGIWYNWAAVHKIDVCVPVYNQSRVLTFPFWGQINFLHARYDRECFIFVHRIVVVVVHAVFATTAHGGWR